MGIRLPAHEKHDRTIDTNGENPSHGPLSDKELQVLPKYLDDALAKGWIQHFISPARALVLFAPKKDGGL